MTAYRFKNLVYIPVFKNASTTYSNFFQSIGWVPWLVDHINWKIDTIFAHISDPYQRHIKGLVEFLASRDLLNHLDSPEFLKLVSHGFFDQHSYPLHMMFGSNVEDILWIPCDHPGIASEHATCRFLQKFDICVTPDMIQRRYVTKSADIHRAREKILIQCEKNNFRSDNQYFALRRDNMIYEASCRQLDNWADKNWTARFDTVKNTTLGP
jgi:hypothetical protein